MSEFSRQEKEIFNLTNENYQLRKKLDFAKRLDALESFCECVECIKTDFEATLKDFEKRLEKLERLKKMSKLVYIASPYAKLHNKEFAVLVAQKACDEIAKRGFYPVSPVLLWGGRISESSSEERAKNIEASKTLLKSCAYIYVAKSKHSKSSVGIKAELDLARELGIKELK